MSNSQSSSEKAPYAEPPAPQQAVHVTGAFFAGAHSFDISGAEFFTIAGDMHQTIRNDHSIKSGFNNRYNRDSRGSQFHTNNYQGTYNDNRRFQSAQYEETTHYIGPGRSGGNFRSDSTPRSQHTAPNNPWSQHSLPRMVEPRQSTFGDQPVFNQPHRINTRNMSADFTFAPNDRGHAYTQEPESYYDTNGPSMPPMRPGSGVKYNSHNPFNQYSHTGSVPIPHGPPTPTGNSRQGYPRVPVTTPEGDPRRWMRGSHPPEQTLDEDREENEMESEMSGLNLDEHPATTAPTPW